MILLKQYPNLFLGNIVFLNLCIRLSPKDFKIIVNSLSVNKSFSLTLQGTVHRNRVYLYSASGYFDSVADYLPEDMVIKPQKTYVIIDDGTVTASGFEKIEEGTCKWIIDQSLWASTLEKVKNEDEEFFDDENIIGGLAAASTVFLAHGKKNINFKGSKGTGIGTVKITVPLPGGYCSSGAANQHPAVRDEMDHRTSLLLGPEGMNKVNSIHIGCIGAGGLGNHFVTAAMHLGIKKFVLVDKDRLEESNLNRFYGAVRKDKGKFKTSLMQKKITGLHREGSVVEVQEFFPSKESILKLEAVDILVAGLDDDRTRLLLQVYALATHRPLLDMGCGIFCDTSGKPDEWGGQWRLSLPGGPCLVCMGLSPEEKNFCVTGEKGYLAGTGITPASIVSWKFYSWLQPKIINISNKII